MEVPGTLVNLINVLRLAFVIRYNSVVLSFQKSKISLKSEQWFTYKNISIHNQYDINIFSNAKTIKLNIVTSHSLSYHLERDFRIQYFAYLILI